MDRQVVAKEKAAKYYGLSAYFLAKVLIEKAFIFLLSSLLYIPLFFLTGLRGVGAFFGTWLTVILHSLTVQVSGGCVALDTHAIQSAGLHLPSRYDDHLKVDIPVKLTFMNIVCY